jgi:predicted metalloprotease
MPAPVVLVAVLVAVALAVAGCGSSSSSSTEPKQTTQASPTTASAQTTQTTETTSATTATDTAVTSKLDQLPESATASGTLPAPPTGRTVDPAYLRAVFNDAQRLWQHEFTAGGIPYAGARLTLFTNAVHSGCGPQENVGPFFCPANRGIYLDLAFFHLLATQAGVGRFAQAYIVGHEFGHHVQHLLGIDRQVAVLNQHDPAGESARSVRVELQADCLAGVWAHSSAARGELTAGDMRDALRAAAIVGDDFQQRAAGRIVDSAMWTHGSSAQRQRWLIAGFESGRPSSCDTFSPAHV